MDASCGCAQKVLSERAAALDKMKPRRDRYRPPRLAAGVSQEGAHMVAVSRAFRIAASSFAGCLLIATFTVQAQTPVKFTLDWRFEGPAAPFTVALDKGYFKAEGLDVTIDTGSGSRESIPRVASGTYDIGAGDVNSLIRFRDENPSIDLKAVMMVYDRPPFAIVGRKSKGITSDPKSLVGKKFGAPAADGAFAQWPIFKSVN
jgi:NitT/TauT family transport system substrate-binding protein